MPYLKNIPDHLFQKISKVLFVLSLGLLLYPILTNHWLVTGDGPCHMYNAKVLKDLFFGQHADFYLDFYKVNTSLNPNLWDHFLFAVLQTLLSPSLAEKVFFILYIFTFAFGAKYLCNTIQSGSNWAVIPVLLFAYHHLMIKGFLNYSWSLAASFWVIGYFIAHWHQLNQWKTALKLCFLITANYLMHPIGYVYAAAGIGFSTLVLMIQPLIREEAKNLLIGQTKKILSLTVILIPSVCLYISFMAKTDFSKSLNWDGLVRVNSLATIVQEEVYYSYFIAKLVVVALFIGILVRIFRGPLLHRGDGLLLLAFFFVFLFHANLIDEGMIGGDRLKFLPHIAVLFWLTTLRHHVWSKLLIMCTGFIFLIILSFVRYPVYKEASEWVDDYLECEKYIEPKSKILTINYEYNGNRSDGTLISTYNWLFIHGTAYLGTFKPLILSDNYQAHMSWFPLNWKENRINFYSSTHKDEISFENRPPRADFEHYAEKSGKGPIEYVLIIGQNEEHKNHEYGKEIISQLEKYDLICTSESQKSQLYRLK